MIMIHLVNLCETKHRLCLTYEALLLHNCFVSHCPTPCAMSRGLQKHINIYRNGSHALCHEARDAISRRQVSVHVHADVYYLGSFTDWVLFLMQTWIACKEH